MINDLHLIDTFGTPTHFVAIDDLIEFPAPSLIEDSEGIRWLLLPFASAPSPHIWAQAASAGVSVLIAPEGESLSFIFTECFMDVRSEDTSGYALPAESWTKIPSWPTYSSLVSATETAEEASGFVHLHTHSEYSPLDGLSRVAEIIEAVQSHGQTAVAITDHGTCAGHPQFQNLADAAGIQPIFGVEAYLVPDRLARPGQAPLASTFSSETEYEKARDAHKAQIKELTHGYYHLVLWAQNDLGLKNIWSMVTESNRDGFYGKPRMDWDTLRRHSEGVIASTACLRGPIASPLLQGDEILARANLAMLMDIYGENLYLEIHTNGLEKQFMVNKAIVGLHHEYKVPLVAVVDSHYPTKAHTEAHQVWIACQTNKDVDDEGDLFNEDLDAYIQSESEVRSNLAYLDSADVNEAIANTTKIANLCTARLSGKTVMPVYSRSGGFERDQERLLDICMESWDRKTLGKRESQEVYVQRFEREFRLLADKKFTGYFLMVADYCRWAKSSGILVGPGRGSGGGSLIAYLCGITGIDPVEADLLFERFLTEGRTSLPDFDVDFPASKRQELTDYIVHRYGAENVARVGTHTRLKSKGVVKDVARAMKSRLPLDYFKDIEAFSKIVTEAESGSAGMGIPWEDLWIEHDEILAPYREKYPEVFSMADALVGRLKSYGRHAAGVVISPDENLTRSLPLRRGEDDQLVAEFDLDALEALGFVKFDLLTIRNLDTLQDSIDATKDRTGTLINFDEWDKDSYDDPAVWDMIAEGHTKGLFQVETSTGTRMAKKMKPRSMNELADLITLVRPGPQRSGLTDLYLARRSGEEAVTFPDPRLERVLSKTYGTLLYQEDIMATCMILGGYDSTEADGVRKILGKKQIDKVEEAGKEFVRRSVDLGMDEQDASVLWGQMAEFAKYSFNRAHAWGYAMITYWCAWFKVHYPVEFLSSLLSTVDKSRIPEFVGEARRMGIKVLPPDINLSGDGFTPGDLEVRYGLNSVKGVGPTAVANIIAQQPFASWEDFMERKGPKVDMGVVGLLARVGAFDSLIPNRKALVDRLAAEKSGAASQCVFKDPGVVNFGLPCTFDWDSEPAPINPRNGKETKKKPLPKRCTKACRSYTAPTEQPAEDLPDYNKLEIREIEHDMLGVYLTTTPFDDFEEEHRLLLRQGAEQASCSENGSFVIGGIITRSVTKNTNKGDAMGFCTIETEAESVDFVVFPKKWNTYKNSIQVGNLYVMEIQKNSRGASMLSAMPAFSESRSNG